MNRFPVPEDGLLFFAMIRALVEAGTIGSSIGDQLELADRLFRRPLLIPQRFT